ncbi:MAG: class I SAM-dependent methyltransferase [Alphaproteobacteria bacterium]
MTVDALTIDQALPNDGEELKSCCAQLYEHEGARLLIGDSLHPGGLELTARLGVALGLNERSHVLDVASGGGASALLLAQRFGCRVTGIDYGARIVERANDTAAHHGVADRVAFEHADAEHLPFADETFDAVLCECAFCLFPDKVRAAAEFARVLKPGGRLALSDLTRNGALPESLTGLMSWVACIADARPVDDYTDHLARAGLDVDDIAPQDDALLTLVKDVQFKLLGADVLVGLGKLDMSKEDVATARNFVREAHAAITRGDLGYVAIIASRGDHRDDR